MCYSVTHDVHSSQPPSGEPVARRRLPRRCPRGDPRRGLEPYDADRHRAPGGGQPDDALPPVARHPDAARRPDDPRVGPCRRGLRGLVPGRQRHPRPDREHDRRDRAGAACQRPPASHRRRRPRGAAALPARPARPQPGDGRRRAGRPDRAGSAGEDRSGAATPSCWHGASCSPATGSPCRRTPCPRRARARPTSPTSTSSSTNWCGGTSPDDHEHFEDRRRAHRRPRVMRCPGHRPGHHWCRGRARRCDPGPLGGGRRRARRRVRHQPVELQAGARRTALPGPRTGRRRARERRRARHPDGDHGTAPHPGAADADAADPRGQPGPGWARPRRAAAR